MQKSALLLSITLIIVLFSASPQSANFSTLQAFWFIAPSLALFVLFFYIAYKKPIAGSKFVTFLFLAGLLLRVIYLSDTPYFVRGHDAEGHVDYIEYIAENRSLPSANACWQCYHPPLYYLLASPICSFASCEGNGAVLLQLISLLFSAGFLYFGIKTLRLYFRDKNHEKYFNLAASLLIFWPSGIIHSVKIGNDSLLYFFIAAGLYFIARWFINGGRKNMWLFLVFLVLSVFTKTNGLILLAVGAGVIVMRYLLLGAKKEVLFAGMEILLLAGIVVSILFLSPVLTAEGDGLKSALVGNVSGLASGLSVGNKISNYAFFDAKEFLTVPYADPWSDAGGRQYFLNYLFKTSLLGEFSFWQDVLKNLAILLSGLFLLLVPLIIAGMVFGFFGEKGIGGLSASKLMVFEILIFAIAMLFFRILFPFSSSGDFRYIYPVVIPLSGVMAYAIYYSNRFSVAHSNQKVARFYKVFGKLEEFIVSVFIIASILFFVVMVIL